MRPSSALVSLSLFAVLLAGCADSGGGEVEPDPFQDFDDVDVDADSGIIRGVVIDSTITPIADVVVKVLNTEMVTQSNQNGAFLLDGLDPGVHFLELSKPGYEAVQASAEVVAGEKEPPIVRVQMIRLPGSEPYFVPLEWAGYLGCSMRYFIEGRTCPGAETIWTEHDFLVDVELDRVPSFVTSDMVWQSTQQLGGEMSFNLRRTDTNADTIDIEGRSPLHLALNESLIEEHDGGIRGGFGPDMPVRVIVFTAHLQETEPPCLPEVGCLWGLGVQIEQDFFTYTHVFYNYAPPEDWVFTSDPEVPRA